MEREPSCCPAVDKTGTCRIPGPRASILTGGRHAAGGCPPAPPGSPRLSAVTGWAPAVPSRLLASTPHLTALLEKKLLMVTRKMFPGNKLTPVENHWPNRA